MPDSSSLLVGTLGDDVRDTLPSQVDPAGRKAVAPVGEYQVRSLTRTPRPARRFRYPNALQYRLELGALVALAGGE